MSGKRYLITAGAFGHPQPEHGFGYLRATYAAHGGCPSCGAGFVQDGAFRFRAEPKARQGQFIGLSWVPDQVFVREQVRLELEREQVTGVRFSRPVLHGTGEPLKTVLQMHVETVLPEALVGRGLKTELCQKPTNKNELRILEAVGSRRLQGPYCGMAKYLFPQERGVAFRKTAFQGQPDVVRTSEWFGSGCGAFRPILVSERVKRIIERNKWQGVFLEEVRVVV
jgi:hypothetical protein